MKHELLTCEWCGSKDFAFSNYYYKLHVRDMRVPHSDINEHIICGDCKDRLKEIE